MPRLGGQPARRVGDIGAGTPPSLRPGQESENENRSYPDYRLGLATPTGHLGFVRGWEEPRFCGLVTLLKFRLLLWDGRVLLSYHAQISTAPPPTLGSSCCPAQFLRLRPAFRFRPQGHTFEGVSEPFRISLARPAQSGALRRARSLPLPPPSSCSFSALPRVTESKTWQRVGPGEPRVLST